MWQGWPLERVIILFTGLAFAMIFVQVTMFHSRQNFRHWSMWLPVLGTPVVAVTAIVYGFFRAEWIEWTFSVLLWITLAEGLFGAYKHTAGVGERVGGYGETQNFLVGPPIVLPLMVSALSVLGLLALFWG
ncbi:hypothetical protein LOK74_23605 [Brevibacillus humidisoli]|uniref:hypothetical protein n=1 Tax=Brevibacillus humidisoli TaxID=2895522 RepID=UPI001E5E34A5|nr:hypothetical protein [Brevibacillus humidisoli]UFJ40935.1 hypothetical protein LOK74_23605 [Brevibacillus humidisoli]